MQRLRASQHRGQRLQRGADDVVLGLLGGERGAGCLRVETKHPRSWVLCAEAVAHDVRPDAPRGAKLGYLLKKIAVGIEEEREARGEAVDHKPGVERGLDVCDAVGER